MTTRDISGTILTLTSDPASLLPHLELSFGPAAIARSAAHATGKPVLTWQVDASYDKVMAQLAPLHSQLASAGTLEAHGLPATSPHLPGLSVQPAHTRPTKLVAFDVDSTVVAGEVITMIGEVMGVGERIDDITTRAMLGELDFTEALHERVGLLAGCSMADIAAIHASLPLHEGARECMAALHGAGIATMLVSGGFTAVLDPLAADLGVTFHHANILEVDEATQTLTGRVIGPIVSRAAKRELVIQAAERLGIGAEHCVAVGDGANDVDMMAWCGFSIGVGHKPVVHEHAASVIPDNHLGTVLDILGIASAIA